MKKEQTRVSPAVLERQRATVARTEYAGLKLTARFQPETAATGLTPWEIEMNSEVPFAVCAL